MTAPILTVRYRVAGTLSPATRDRWNALMLAAALRGPAIAVGYAHGGDPWYCARAGAAEDALRALATGLLRVVPEVTDGEVTL